MSERLIASLLAVLTFASATVAQVVTLSGVVRDAATNEPLPAANIRVEGTSKGTVANALGVYKLSLESDNYTIIYSFIGYRSDTLHVILDHATEYDPRLQPSAVQLAEVIVTSEDPAMAIMRRVIEHKKKWMETLQSYEFDAFTRFTLRRDTSIAMITESYTTGYWRKGDTLREVVRQKRHTENIPGLSNIAVGGSVVNFYDDNVAFAGFNFVGPTSTEAFDYYDFKLEKTGQRDGVPVYYISVLPKTRLAPLFRGRLNVIGDTYALIGVDVVPNEAFTIPFVSRFDIHYTQQFSLYEGNYWMPMDVRLSGKIDINLLGFSIPHIGVDQASVLYDYKINRQLPDSMFKKGHVVELPSAQKFDSLFWVQRDVLPLTREEKVAYQTLDSTQTLEKQFKPSGPLSGLDALSSGILGYARVHFTRADGAFLGLQARRDSVTNHLSLFGWSGYGFADRRWEFDVGGTVFFDAARQFSLTLQGYRELDNIPDEGYYPSLAISLATLLTKVDYRDYYYSDGWRAFLRSQPEDRICLQLGYRNEMEISASKRTDFSIFDRNKPFRANPAIDEGMMRSLSLNAHFGDEPIPLGLITRNFAEIEIEHADHTLLASALDFTRYVFRGEARITTYSSRLLFPPTLNLKLTAGASAGDLPPQRVFSLESQYDDVAPFGVLRGGGIKEFSGRSFVSLSIEHNFRSTPFLLLNIPYLYKNSIELILHGNVAQTWSSSPLPFGRTTDGWYSEAGIGVSRILTLFRIDITRRFALPRGTFLTVGVAQVL